MEEIYSNDYGIFLLKFFGWFFGCVVSDGFNILVWFEFWILKKNVCYRVILGVSGIKDGDDVFGGYFDRLKSV